MAGSFLFSAANEEAPSRHKKRQVFLEIDRAHTPNCSARARSVGRWVRAPSANRGCGSAGQTARRAEGSAPPAPPPARVERRSRVKPGQGTHRLLGDFCEGLRWITMRPNGYRARWNSALFRYTSSLTKEQCSLGRDALPG